MLRLAVAVLGLAVVLGGALAIAALRSSGKKPPRLLATLHGLCAVTGYGILLLALRGPVRGAASGTQSFGLAAAILLLVAALFGIASFILHRRRGRVPGFWIGAHAMIAVTAYVILAAYLLAG